MQPVWAYLNLPKPDMLIIQILPWEPDMVIIQKFAKEPDMVIFRNCRGTEYGDYPEIAAEPDMVIMGNCRGTGYGDYRKLPRNRIWWLSRNCRGTGCGAVAQQQHLFICKVDTLNRHRCLPYKQFRANLQHHLICDQTFLKYFELSVELKAGNTELFGTWGLQQVETSKNPSSIGLAWGYDDK